MPLLNPVHRLPIETRQLSEPLLRELAFPTHLTNAVAESPAAGKDPVGRRDRRHPTTLSGS